MKKSTAIVAGITKDYTFALANTLIGLKKYNKKFWDDIIVFHDGIDKKEQKAIQSIIEVRFIDVSDLESFQKITSANIKTLEKYSIATFYRYECFKLLDEYKKIIWTDVDILIQKDISKICSYADETGLALPRDLNDFTVASSLSKIIPEYNMFHHLWDVGIMVLSDKLKNYSEIHDWCFDATIKYQENLLWPDLAIINLMIQDFSLDIEEVDIKKYQCYIGSEDVGDAAIVHAYGDKKFWNDVDLFRNFPEWEQNAIKWNKTLYQEYKDTLPEISCIMSTVDRYEFLEESINSILAQSYPNFELEIVVMEGAKNQTKIEKIINNFHDERIKILKNKEKLGFSDSLNMCIESARGKYLARIDDDDIAAPTRFFEEKVFLDEHPSVGIVGSKIQIFGKSSGIVYVHADPALNRAQTLVGTPLMHPTVMMKKSMLDKYGLRYNRDYFAEDYELWSRAVYCFDIANIQKVLCFYRSHDNQITNSTINGNEEKIHSCHKRIMQNQLKSQLNITLTDNELEMIQFRKDRTRYITDQEGLDLLRKSAVQKIYEANKSKNIFDETSLATILLSSGETFEKEPEPKTKSISKKVVRKLINPVYGRLMDRIENNIVVPHIEDLRLELKKKEESKNEK